LSATAAFDLLSKQPDFAEQRSWLREVVTKRGHMAEFYPKFHCELNFIEKAWTYSKHKLRALCDYTFVSLMENVPKVLKEMSVSFFAACARSCSRYVLAYGKVNGNYLTFAQVRFAHKKYTSHRRVPHSELMAELRKANLA
jgi:hypothetical protein